MHETQTRQGADLVKEGPNLKSTWLFDEVMNVRSRDLFKNLYLSLHKVWQSAGFREEIQHANA